MSGELGLPVRDAHGAAQSAPADRWPDGGSSAVVCAKGAWMMAMDIIIFDSLAATTGCSGGVRA